MLVTVDVEPPEVYDYKAVDPDFDDRKEILGPRQWKRHYESHALNYLPLGLSEDDFAKSKLVVRSTEVLKVAFNKPVVARHDLRFVPLFNFVYKDSHSMLTMGGMIAGRAERRLLQGSSLSEAIYYRRGFDLPPFEIRVPRLTKKERIYLDREMPCGDDWAPKDFDLDSDDARRYRELYRFLPAFAEILL